MSDNVTNEKRELKSDTSNTYELAIETSKLCKTFGKKKSKSLWKREASEPIHAVTDLSLEVRKGEVFGFIGPNGAGKTTTMKMLIGLLEPSSGSGKVAGYDIIRQVIDIRERTGVLPEPAGFYDNLTARQNLRFYAKLYDSIPADTREKRIEDLLETVGIPHAIDQKIGGFSTGMRKRFGLAQALINDPEVLFLDEPTSGIDPLGAQMMRDLIRKLNKSRGVTVFLSSHSMEEVEEICDRLAIIAKGRLLAVGSVEDLRDLVRKKDGVYYLLDVQDMALERAVELVRDMVGVLGVEVLGNTVRVHSKERNGADIARVIVKGGGTLAKLEEQEMNLQKLFLRIVEGV